VISAGCGTLNTQPSGLQAKLEQNERQLWPWQEIGAVVAHVKTTIKCSALLAATTE